MPFIKCKKCTFAIAPGDEQTNHRCRRLAPTPSFSVSMSSKTYWPIVNINEDGCGEGELKKER